MCLVRPRDMGSFKPRMAGDGLTSSPWCLVLLYWILYWISSQVLLFSANLCKGMLDLAMSRKACYSA